MRISQLPKKEKELALLRQIECRVFNYDKTTDNLVKAFDWYDTIEGDEYWSNWHFKKEVKEQLENNK